MLAFVFHSVAAQETPASTSVPATEATPAAIDSGAFASLTPAATPRTFKAKKQASDPKLTNELSKLSDALDKQAKNFNSVLELLKSSSPVTTGAQTPGADTSLGLFSPSVNMSMGLNGMVSPAMQQAADLKAELNTIKMLLLAGGGLGLGAGATSLGGGSASNINSPLLAALQSGAGATGEGKQTDTAGVSKMQSLTNVNVGDEDEKNKEAAEKKENDEEEAKKKQEEYKNGATARLTELQRTLVHLQTKVG